MQKINLIKINKIEYTDTETEMYDLEVEDNHNFFLKGDILTHNSGKSSFLSSLGQITNKGNVIDKPGSQAGISKGITDDGYIVFDEIGGLTSEQRRALYSFLFQSGGMNTHWVTGKAESAAHKLLSKYDITNMSCIILCNLYEDYMWDGMQIDTKRKKSFFHYMFSNSQAINRRFLPLRMHSADTPIGNQQRQLLGEYLPANQFKRDNQHLTDNIKQAYINIMKTCEHYKENWDTETDWEYVDKVCTSVPCRQEHLLTYREMMSGIYVYAKCYGFENLEKIFVRYKGVFDTWIRNYYESLEKYKEVDK